jgi:hypothetical protein
MNLGGNDYFGALERTTKPVALIAGADDARRVLQGALPGIGGGPGAHLGEADVVLRSVRNDAILTMLSRVAPASASTFSMLANTWRRRSRGY